MFTRKDLREFGLICRRRSTNLIPIPSPPHFIFQYIHFTFLIFFRNLLHFWVFFCPLDLQVTPRVRSTHANVTRAQPNKSFPVHRTSAISESRPLRITVATLLSGGGQSPTGNWGWPICQLALNKIVPGNRSVCPRTGTVISGKVSRKVSNTEKCLQHGEVEPRPELGRLGEVVRLLVVAKLCRSDS